MNNQQGRNMFKKIRHASLFTGIGGFDLAAQWMGWENVFQVEIDPFCQKVLYKNFPKTLKVQDVHDVTVDNYGNLLYLNEKNVEVMGQPRSSKYNNCVELYESGLSIQDCANFYEISRQAMHKILSRRNCKFRDSLKFGSDNHFFRGASPDFTKKKRAEHLVEKAVKKGLLINPGVCSRCGQPKIFKNGSSGIHAHHNDYDKPLEVTWLCQECHYLWHQENKPLNETDIEKTNEPSGAVDVLSGGFP